MIFPGMPEQTGLGPAAEKYWNPVCRKYWSISVPEVFLFAAGEK